MKPSPDAPRMPSKLGQIRGNPDGWQPYLYGVYFNLFFKLSLNVIQYL